MKAVEFIKKYGLDVAKHKVDELKIIESMGDKLSIEDEKLKSLVESHELIESYGGLESAKKFMGSEYRKLSQPKTYNRLCEAILDVESCK